MCIRDSPETNWPADENQTQTKLRRRHTRFHMRAGIINCTCLLYTSDAADERSSVDLGGRRIIKKKKNITRDDISKTRTKTTQTQQ